MTQPLSLLGPSPSHLPSMAVLEQGHEREKQKAQGPLKHSFRSPIDLSHPLGIELIRNLHGSMKWCHDSNKQT